MHMELSASGTIVRGTSLLVNVVVDYEFQVDFARVMTHLHPGTPPSLLRLAGHTCGSGVVSDTILRSKGD